MNNIDNNYIYNLIRKLNYHLFLNNVISLDIDIPSNNNNGVT